MRDDDPNWCSTPGCGFPDGRPCIKCGLVVKPRGGKRLGAGRKPRPVAREALTLRVEPIIAERFRKLCEAKGRSQSEQFTAMVKHARF